jgi:hypothetical protein
VGGDSGGVDAALVGEQDGELLKHGGAEGDQGLGPQPGGAPPPLLFQPDDRFQDQGGRGACGKAPDADCRE